MIKGFRFLNILNLFVVICQSFYYFSVFVPLTKNIYDATHIPKVIKMSDIIAFNESCAVPTSPFPIRQPCAINAPNPINALPITAFIICLPFGNIIWNSLLNIDVINEPAIIPITSIDPKPKLWSKIFHPPTIALGLRNV